MVISAMQLSCIDQIDLNLDSVDSQVVVYGWITNEAKPYEISVYYSNGYSDQTGYPPLSGASVYVTDQANNVFEFIEESKTGIYKSDTSTFKGIPGNSYRLTIQYGSEVYVSGIEEMPILSDVEDVFINFIADPSEFEIESKDENFFISGFVNDDVKRSNFYRWKIFVNNELRNLPEELVLFDDEFTNGNKFKFDAGNVLFTQSDQVSLEHMSLSLTAYNYFKNIKDQTSSSTLTPRIQPGIILGNMINVNDPQEQILGFFGASEVKKIIVEN